MRAGINKRASHVKAYAVPATNGLPARAVPNTTLLATTIFCGDNATELAVLPSAFQLAVNPHAADK